VREFMRRGSVHAATGQPQDVENRTPRERDAGRRKSRTILAKLNGRRCYWPVKDSSTERKSSLTNSSTWRCASAMARSMPWRGLAIMPGPRPLRAYPDIEGNYTHETFF
jgi:hypothetical protein